MIDSLATALKEFEGGVILVSHDMRLISQVAPRAARACGVSCGVCGAVA